MNGGVYSLYTRDRHGLLNAMMSALASDTTKISFEGTLSHTDLLRIAGVTHDESESFDGQPLRHSETS